MEKIFEILRQSPIVTIICTTVVLLVLIYILRNQIVEYVKKRYNLLSAEDVRYKLLDYYTDEKLEKIVKKVFK